MQIFTEANETDWHQNSRTAATTNRWSQWQRSERERSFDAGVRSEEIEEGNPTPLRAAEPNR